MNLDTTINLEGAVAATAIFAAAIGYIINLILSAIDKRKQNRQRADELVLIEILEENPLDGLSEEGISKRFKSERYQVLGRKLGASPPKKITQDYLVGRLMALQYDGFLDRTVSRNYVIRTGFEKYREREIETANQRRSYIQSKVDLEKVLVILKTNQDKLNEWDRIRTIETYSKIATEGAIDELIQELESPNPKFASAAAWEIASLIQTNR